MAITGIDIIIVIEIVMVTSIGQNTGIKMASIITKEAETISGLMTTIGMAFMVFWDSIWILTIPRTETIPVMTNYQVY